MISYEHSNEDTLEMWLTLVKALYQILYQVLFKVFCFTYIWFFVVPGRMHPHLTDVYVIGITDEILIKPFCFRKPSLASIVC